MKRYIFIATSFLLLASLTAYADAISSKDAESLAADYAGTNAVSLAWDGSSISKSANTQPAFFVFNRKDGGWVVISGDTCTSVPVLAHSDEGSFDPDNIPAAVRSWFSILSENIDNARLKGVRCKSKSAWVSSASGTKADSGSYKLLETAKWNQGAPYNTYCPSSSMTGCVATAMGIVLRYNRWPNQGKGTIPAYTTLTEKYRVPAININGYTYDWSSMPLTDGSRSGWTGAQKEAVARLIQQLGAMVEMDYTKDGSSAFDSKVIAALHQYMSYSSNAQLIYRYSCTNSEWFNKLAAEIDAGRPVIYGGQDEESGAGHEFICDGYNAANEIHINWGWGGFCDAWYSVSYFGDTDKEKINGVFNYLDSGIFGLVKDDGKSHTPALYQELMNQEGTSYCPGMELVSGTTAKGADFKLNVINIANSDRSQTYTGAVRIALEDRKGNLKEYVSSPINYKIEPLMMMTLKNISCKITKETEFGDKLVPYYKMSEGSWIRLGTYCNLPLSSGSMSVFDIPYIDMPSTISAGTSIYPSLVNSQKKITSLEWFWDKKNINREYLKPGAGAHEISVEIHYADGSREKLTKKVMVR